MGTTLELISEIRERIVGRSTGRLTIRFPDRECQILFDNGDVTLDETGLEAYMDRPPVRFGFEPGRVPMPPERQAGAGILVDALDELDDEALARIWEPYRHWTISFLQDPSVHGSAVSTHLEKDSDRLGRLLRLAVIGALRLVPPQERSVEDELERVVRAAPSGDPWKVLDLPPFAPRPEIRRQYRKLARHLHPDRWPMLEDGSLRQRVEQAFREVRTSYERALALVEANRDEPTPPRPRAVGAYEAPPGSPPDGLFRRIFDSFVKKAS